MKHPAGMSGTTPNGFTSQPRKGKRAAERSDDSTKICTRCTNELSIYMFALSKMGSFGVSSICKDCRINASSNTGGRTTMIDAREMARIER